MLFLALVAISLPAFPGPAGPDGHQGPRGWSRSCSPHSPASPAYPLRALSTSQQAAPSPPITIPGAYVTGRCARSGSHSLPPFHLLARYSVEPQEPPAPMCGPASLPRGKTLHVALLSLGEQGLPGMPGTRGLPGPSGDPGKPGKEWEEGAGHAMCVCVYIPF